MIHRIQATVAVALLASLVLALDALAGPARLTHAQYQSKLDRANAEVTKVETAAERGLTPKATRARVKTLLLAWAATETRLGHSFQTLSPPANTVRGNAALARGEITFGGELGYAATHLPQRKAQIKTFLEHRLGSAKGGGMIDSALALLKKAGYRVG